MRILPSPPRVPGETPDTAIDTTCAIGPPAGTPAVRDPLLPAEPPVKYRQRRSFFSPYIE
jgi:hypothetical protein